MALVEVKLEPDVLNRICKALEKIASNIDTLIPPRPELLTKGPATEDDLIEFNVEAECERETEEERQRNLGLPAKR